MRWRKVSFSFRIPRQSYSSRVQHHLYHLRASTCFVLLIVAASMVREFSLTCMLIVVTFEKPILRLLRSILFASMATNMFTCLMLPHRLADRPLPDDSSFEYLLSLKSNAHNALNQLSCFLGFRPHDWSARARAIMCFAWSLATSSPS
jgi:hypothetical protein